MMKNSLIIIILIWTQSVFAQSPFSLRQIDSIADLKGRSGIAEGQIKSEKLKLAKGGQKYIDGEGQSSVAIYHYETPTFTRLIKADYHRNVRYEDKSSEEVFAQFYFNEKQLFFVKIKEIINHGKESITKDHNINVSELNKLQNSDFLFTDNIQKWVAQLNTQMIDLSAKKRTKKN